MGANVLFIGNYTDDKTYELITKKGIRDLSQAARLFQQRLINNLSELSDSFNAVSFLPTDKNTTLPKTLGDTKKRIEVIPIETGSVNSIRTGMRRLEDLIKNECGRETKVLMYAVNPIALVPLLKLKKKYRLTLVTVCPELPQFRRYKKNLKSDIKRKVFGFFNRRFDKYIVFAEAMKEYLPTEKPCMLLEGLAPDIIQEPSIRKSNIALYAGGLAEDNGIKMMIEAAHLSINIDELWICGVGDCLEYVKKNCDNKVKYLGRLSIDEVIENELKAKVLLNVRNPENELTRFSFPSKVLEYMAAGGIVVSSELPGIPEEYFQHIELLKDYSANCLANVMDKVFEMSDGDFLKKTKKANSFVEMKSAKQRAHDVLMFIEQGERDENKKNI